MERARPASPSLGWAGRKREREEGVAGAFLFCNEWGNWYSVPGYAAERLRGSDEGFLQIWRPTGGWGAPTRGTLHPSGYRAVGVNRKHRKVHDLLCTIWYGLKSYSSWTAQHGRGGKGDNSRTNLLGWATKKQQVTEHIAKRTATSGGKPILVWPVGASSTDAKWYANSNQAAQDTGAPTLERVASGSHKQSSGYCAKWAPALEPQDDLPFEGYAPGHNLAEEWRKVTPNLWVSNRGRSCRKHNHGAAFGHKVTRQPSKGEVYATCSVNNKLMGFHVVIFDAFFPGVRKGRTVDHIDRTKTNNQLSNLRPATRVEQNANRTLKPSANRGASTKKPMRGRPVGTDRWVIEAQCTVDAAKKLTQHTGKAANGSPLSLAARQNRPYKGWEFQYVKVRRAHT